jgi:hypothetical protein
MNPAFGADLSPVGGNYGQESREKDGKKEN